MLKEDRCTLAVGQLSVQFNLLRLFYGCQSVFLGQIAIQLAYCNPMFLGQVTVVAVLTLCSVFLGQVSVQCLMDSCCTAFQIHVTANYVSRLQ